MRALLTALIAAIEACAIAVASLVLIAVPALLLWWLEFDLAAEPETVASTISGIWFLGHLSPIEFTLDAETALGFGLAPEVLRVTISFVPLGLALLTALLAFRAGWRFADRGGPGIAGVIGGTLGFAVAATAIGWLGDPPLSAQLWIGVLLAAACFACGGLIAFVWHAAVNGHVWWHNVIRWAQHRFGRVGEFLPEVARDTVRLAVAGAVALLGLGAFGFTCALVAGYVEIVTLSQTMQLDVLGVIMLFLVNLLLLPTACIWALAWLSGAGFAVGSGTSVSPFDMLLGPIPALPIFGALPQGWGWAGILAPLLIVLAGVLVGAALATAMIRRHSGWVSGAVIPVVAAILVGLTVAGFASLAGGSMGPGRMGESGPDPLLTGALIAIELGVGMIIGVAVRRVDGSRVSARLAQLPDSPARPDSNFASLPSADVVRSVNVASNEPAPQLAQAETVPLTPLGNEQGGQRADAETVPVAPLQPGADANAEDLVRAYAWDETVDLPASHNAPEASAKRSNWPWPWRRR